MPVLASIWRYLVVSVDPDLVRRFGNTDRVIFVSIEDEAYLNAPMMVL